MTRLPDYVKLYFWGDDLSDLSWEKHRNYIIQTLLEKGDVPSLHWLFARISKSEVKKLLPNLHLQPRSNHFWNIYLS